MSFQITREIGIDAGHRVTHHGSKCKNLHGHRYRIQAICEGNLFQSGPQQGMVLDFSFLKDEMMEQIDQPCDHGTMLWIEDPFVFDFAGKNQYLESDWKKAVKEIGYCSTPYGRFGKLYLVDFVPTAENLAKHWFDRLEPRVKIRTEGQGKLVGVIVWETPNCAAQYPSTFKESTYAENF